MVSRQNDREMRGHRLDDAASNAIIEALAAANGRVKGQVPGGEKVLRDLLAGLASGKPDYDQMSTSLSEQTRIQLPQLQKDGDAAWTDPNSCV